MRDFRDRANRILNHAKKNFGEKCILIYQSGPQVSFTGIFDNSHVYVDTDTEQQITSTQPILGVNLFDFENDPSQGDKVQIRNLTYKIIDIQKDGQGGATLALHQMDHEQKIFKKKSS